MMPLARTITRGFTLIEVLVALAVVAIALAAGIQASNTLLASANRQRESLLAQLCLENAFTALRLNSMTGAGRPPTGQSEKDCTQAGLDYKVQLTVGSTPNPNIVRIDGSVQNAAGNSVLSLSSVLGPP